MHSTGDPLSNPTSGIWGIVWMRNVSAAGIIVIIYDCLLTLDDEVRLISLYLYHFSALPFVPQIRLVWPGPSSLPKGLYYINRYLTIVMVMYTNYRQ
jgi:hypothetical protein